MYHLKKKIYILSLTMASVTYDTQCKQCNGLLTEPAYGQHLVEGKVRVPCRLSILGCDHIFHQECLKRWIKTQKNKGISTPTCPICEVVIEKIENVTNEIEEVEVEDKEETTVEDSEVIKSDEEYALMLQNEEYANYM